MKPIALITGGAGFIGSRLAQRLADRFDVVAFDNLHPQIHPTGKRPDTLPESARLIEADVRDAAAWDVALKQYAPAVIVHLAAETGTGQSLTESARHGSVNVVGTCEMLDALVRQKTFPEHIVLASSRAVYGEGAWKDASGNIFYPKQRSEKDLGAGQWKLLGSDGREATPLKNDAAVTAPHPSSVYGATKLTQEHILTSWALSFNVPISVFRLQNVYGPGQTPANPYTGIMSLFHKLGTLNQQIEVYEDGDIGRDFVFIDDVVKTLAAGIHTAPKSGTRTIDVGTGVTTTILEAANSIAKLYNAPTPRISGKYRNGDIRYATADATALERELGIRCDVTFEQGNLALRDWIRSTL